MKSHLKSVLAAAACVLALGIGTAKATTFAVSGTDGFTLGGTITIDVTTGTIPAGGEDVTVTGLSGVGPFTSDPVVSHPLHEFSAIVTELFDNDGHSNNLSLYLPVSTLVGYAGGAICAVDNAGSSPCDQGTLSGFGEDLLFSGSLTPVATPLPAALPLFGTGIGGLGLLGWRRKRKAQAV